MKLKHFSLFLITITSINNLRSEKIIEIINDIGKEFYIGKKKPLVFGIKDKQGKSISTDDKYEFVEDKAIITLDDKKLKELQKIGLQSIYIQAQGGVFRRKFLKTPVEDIIWLSLDNNTPVGILDSRTDYGLLGLLQHRSLKKIFERHSVIHVTRNIKRYFNISSQI